MGATSSGIVRGIIRPATSGVGSRNILKYGDHRSAPPSRSSRRRKRRPGFFSTSDLHRLHSRGCHRPNRLLRAWGETRSDPRGDLPLAGVTLFDSTSPSSTTRPTGQGVKNFEATSRKFARGLPDPGSSIGIFPSGPGPSMDRHQLGFCRTTIADRAGFLVVWVPVLRTAGCMNSVWLRRSFAPAGTGGIW